MISMLLHALARCTPAPHCHIIGDGPEREHLAALARQLQLSTVTFRGQLPRPQTLDLIAGATLLVSCSAQEGAPTAVREARALGTAVLATPAGDIARWAERDSGIELVAPTAAALAQVLSRHASAAVT